ncbi:MAG: Ig-like domain-containing protein, partial [bacterium]
MGNISQNPSFVESPSCYSSQLDPSSPCVDKGDPTIDALPGGGDYCDIGVLDIPGDGGDSNRCPKAGLSLVYPLEDTPILDTCSASDEDEDPLTYRVINGPSHGILYPFDKYSGAFVYTPSSDYDSTDQFTFEASDGVCLSNPGTVSIFVTPVNDPPIVSDIPDQEISASGIFAIFDLDGYVNDADDDTSSLDWNPSGQDSLDVKIDPSTHKVTITRKYEAWRGSEYITFTAYDPDSASGYDAAWFTVRPPNPAVQLDSSYYLFTATEGTSNPEPQSLLVHNAGEGTLHWTATDSATWLTLSNTSGENDGSILISVDITGLAAGTLFGTITVTAAESDSADTPSAQAVVELQINENQPPVARDTTVSCFEDGSVVVQLQAWDPEGDAITYEVVDSGSLGAVADFDSLAGTLLYTPAADSNNSDLLTFLAHSFDAASEVGTVYVEIAPVNDPPFFRDTIPDQTINEGDAFAPIDLSVDDIDNPGSELTCSATGQESLTVECSEELQVTVVPPDSDWFGEETITFTVYDDSGASASDVVVFTVVNVPDPPVCFDIQYEIDEDSVLDGCFPATDADGDALSFIIWSEPVHGQLKDFDTSTCSFTYTPDLDFSGSDQIGYQASDAVYTSGRCLCEITINPVCDAPMVREISDFHFGEGDTMITVLLDDQVFDVDDTVSNISWQITPICGNFQTTINDRVLEIKPRDRSRPRADRLMFVATDPCEQADTALADVLMDGNNVMVCDDISAGTYRMISLPLMPSSFNADTLLGDLIAGRPEYDWRLERWDPTLQQYDTDIDRLEPGGAYWILSKGGSNLSISGESIPPNQLSTFPNRPDSTFGFYEIELWPGWNQIGPPTTYAIDFLACYAGDWTGDKYWMADAGALELNPVSPALYHYNGNGTDVTLCYDAFQDGAAT